MSSSIRALGFKPPDAKWEMMKAVWDACSEAEVEPPDEVDNFFCGEPPDEEGVRVEEHMLKVCGAIKQFRAEMMDGFDIHVDKIPKDVKIIRIYNSY